MKLLHTILPAAGAALVLALAQGSASAYDGEPIHETGAVSAGLAVGDVTAFDLKWWFTEHHGIDFGIGVSQFSERLAVYAEGELALAEWGMGSDARGLFYLGPGIQGIVNSPGRDQVALTAPIGLDFQFRAPLDIFVEARPGIALTPNTDLIIGGQAGLRVIF